MRMIAAILTLCVLPACAATTSEGPATPPQAGAGRCVADELGAYTGQKATAAIGIELLAKSGARTLRWGPPRSAMTMDYREDRLTVAYDDDMIITSAHCG